MASYMYRYVSACIIWFSLNTVNNKILGIVKAGKFPLLSLYKTHGLVIEQKVLAVLPLKSPALPHAVASSGRQQTTEVVVGKIDKRKVCSLSGQDLIWMIGYAPL